MKTLIIVLLCSIYTYGQNFIMKMSVVEVYDDITIKYDSIRVIWGIGKKEDISFIWGSPKKMIHLTRRNLYPNRSQTKIIKKIVEQYALYTKGKKILEHIKIQSLYYNRWHEMFFITVYMDEGIMIWINRVDDKTPCYYFGMINQ